MEAPARELIQVPLAVAPEPAADTRVSHEEPLADNQPVQQEPLNEAPLEVAGEQEESKTSVNTPKGTQQLPDAKKVANAPTVSKLVSGALRNVGVYLPPALLAQVKDAVYQERTTYADLLIDAFETVEDKQIAKEFATETKLTKSGMPRRAPRKRGEAGIQIQLRLDGLQVAWLDEKVAEFDAPSRSALVSAVFKLYIQSIQTSHE
ncbi:hypothetical protein LFT44_21055 (plasmid) [Arthrobacter sp. FW306-05-C]|uniref:hypothetical protein n=1 Tax=Arthrobacter sp. FW306-05-C TaxID=2879620 RepID=UPI001F211216|nr:hypothetical protein [Arthrobacter sp. FW306-05-C]UKA69018.1 hypothetical protein LFT44_21055 [Arthrobacter sp. FW306-05-C]